jgi:hypothetical protein
MSKAEEYTSKSFYGTDELTDAIDEVGHRLGYRSRSALVRAGTRLILEYGIRSGDNVHPDTNPEEHITSGFNDYSSYQPDGADPVEADHADTQTHE